MLELTAATLAYLCCPDCGARSPTVRVDSGRAKALACDGRAGARLLPIAEYSYMGLPPEANREWAVLDTFDMLSPQFDLPQSAGTVGAWFEAEGFTNVEVFRGPNGIIARGIAP